MATELNGTKRELNKSGYYEHKETGAVVRVIDDPEYGSPQADAFVQAGYVFIGEEKPAAISANKKEDK